MKASELRIGNWINSTINDPLMPKPIMGDFQVEAWHIVSMVEFEKTSRMWANVRPIPLTKEWINRIDWRGYIPLHFNSNFCLDDVGHIYYHNDYTGINVSYVHQLQNLYFALTGEELTLE